MLTGCPKRHVGADAWRWLELADFARRGILPQAGGLFEQPEGLMDGIRYVWDCEASHRIKRGMSD